MCTCASACVQIRMQQCTYMPECARVMCECRVHTCACVLHVCIHVRVSVCVCVCVCVCVSCVRAIRQWAGLEHLQPLFHSQGPCGQMRGGLVTEGCLE